MKPDPLPLLRRLAGGEGERPFRLLPRRLIQAVAAAAVTNRILGRRSAPGAYLVVRVCEDEAEREEWVQLFKESRTEIEAEVAREARARAIALRSTLQVELLALLASDLRQSRGRELIEHHAGAGSGPHVAALLTQQPEAIVAVPTSSLDVDSKPDGAQAYLDGRPAGVTPCVVEDVTPGQHLLGLSRPGFLYREEPVSVPAGGGRQSVQVELAPEPAMGHILVDTLPPGGHVRIGAEERSAPSLWRLPAGEVVLTASMDGYRAETRRLELDACPAERPQRVRVRLEYAGDDWAEVVGRLTIWRREISAPPPARQSNSLAEFFFRSDADDEWAGRKDAIEIPPEGGAVLLEVPLRRGLFVMGREDPGGPVQPDIVLTDAENSVSRGCHAWLWIYQDRSTGAAYNTFLIGAESPSGVRVDGVPVTRTKRLGDDALIEIGSFTLRLQRVVPPPRVELRGSLEGTGATPAPGWS